MERNDVAKLKEADEVACNMLNEVAKTHQELPMALLIVAIMFGRLRYDARMQGADPQEVDDLFQQHVNVITDALDS